MNEKYQWADASEAFDAYCIYIGVDASMDLVSTAFGIIPETKQLANSREMLYLPGLGDGGNDVVQLGAIGNAAIALENNGWTGVEESVIKHIAAPISVSIYRNINAVMTFVYAKHGNTIRQFDPVLYDPTGAIAAEQTFDFENGEPESLALALAETLTGIEIDRDWLLEIRRPTYRRV